MSIANLNDKQHNITVHEIITDLINGVPYVPSLGDVTLAPVSNASNANGATLVGQQLNLEAANAFFPGVVTAGNQQFGGNKDFLGMITAANFTGNSSGTNTGDVSLGPVGAAPNVNAATLVGQQLNLEPANALNPGVISTVAQSISGDKTFNDAILPNLIIMPDTTSPNDGVIRFGLATSMLHNFSNNVTRTNTFLGPNAGAGFSATGIGNTGLGNNSLMQIGAGNDNTCVGSDSGGALNAASNNILIGQGAGSSIVNGNNNILIGAAGGFDTTGAVIIGEVGLQTSVNIRGVSNVTANVNAKTMMIDNANGTVSATFPPVNALGAMDSAIGANANGCAITITPSGQEFCLNSATPTRVGGIDLGLQMFAGAKQFLDGVLFGNPGGVGFSVLNYYNVFNEGAKTPTLDSGTITGMTVRGIVATFFSDFRVTKLGNLVTFTIPRFSVTSVAGGPPQVFIVTGATPITAPYRPTFDMFLPALMFNGGAGVPSLAIVQIFAATGNVSLVIAGSPTNLVPGFGLAADFTVNYEVVV